MSDQPQPVEHADPVLMFVATLFSLVHLAIAYLMAIVRHVGNSFAAIIYAVISLGGIGLGYWLLKRKPLRFRSAIFLILGVMLSLGMMWFGDWLLMAFARGF